MKVIRSAILPGSRNCRSLTTMPAASPNFGVARVLIEEQKTIRKIGIELQLPEPLIGGAAVLSNTRP